MNFNSIPNERKKAVENIVQDLLQKTRIGTSHVSVGKLSDLECRYALHIGQSFGLRMETIKGIGKCLFCPRTIR